MVVQAQTGLYHVHAANTNRIKFYRVASGVANAFLASSTGWLRGNRPFYPYIGQFSDNPPTTNELIAAARADAIVRALSIYAPPVHLEIPTSNGGFAYSTIIMGFETSESGVLVAATDISDTLGLAGQSAKTKSGLRTLATAVVANAQLGIVKLFAINADLADGTASTAPAIAGLTVTLLSFAT